VKRAFDLCLSLVLLTVSTPLLVLIGVSILFDDGLPLVFRQVRVGHHGHPFSMVKFRTMRGTAGSPLTIGDDARITRVGRFLRRWKLDELPQLVNVIHGDMSLVGWRPELPEYVSRNGELYEPLLQFIPGIVDPAALRYRNESELLASEDDPETYYQEVLLPRKVSISLEYARQASLLSDLRVLTRLVK
jgi:lipopolysaccharide/colanic/teichoic acid biosynthesis glycosyltransferase